MDSMMVRSFLVSIRLSESQYDYHKMKNILQHCIKEKYTKNIAVYYFRNGIESQLAVKDLS